MPVKRLPSNPRLNHLKYQAKDLLKGRAAGDPAVAQRIREFHPLFARATNAEIFSAQLKLTDAQLTIAREYGFSSWMRLKRHLDRPTLADNLNLPLHERVEDSSFRLAINLLDAGNTAGLRAHLESHPQLARQRVLLEGGNYFRNPTLLEFVAENPIRHGALPPNIVEVAEIILEAGAKRNIPAVNETLGLVCSGRVPRECGLQIPLINLLCDHGADPNSAVLPAIVHGEFTALRELLRHGAQMDLTVAAAMGLEEDARRLIANADAEIRQRALASASQFGHTAIVRLLLDAGADPKRYNPVGFHSHSTPLHQAALAGHEEVVRLLVEHGAPLHAIDTLWHGTPAGWAKYGGNTAVERYLLTRENHGV